MPQATTAAAQPESSVTPYAPSPSTTANQPPQLANKPRTNHAQRRKLHDDETRVEEGGRLKSAVPEEIVGMSYGTEERDTHHTSQVTRFTSHVKRHRSNAKSHTSNVTRHTSSHVTRHTSNVKFHTSHVTRCKRNVRANPSRRTCAASSAAVAAAAAAADAGSLLLQTKPRATSKSIEFAAAAAAANCSSRDQQAAPHGLNKPAAAAHVIVTRGHEAQCTCRLEACKTERKRRRRCCVCCHRRLQRKT